MGVGRPTQRCRTAFASMIWSNGVKFPDSQDRRGRIAWLKRTSCVLFLNGWLARRLVGSQVSVAGSAGGLQQHGFRRFKCGHASFRTWFRVRAWSLVRDSTPRRNNLLVASMIETIVHRGWVGRLIGSNCFLRLFEAFNTRPRCRVAG